MPVYAVGDLQGCYDPFRRLLDRLAFDPGRDRLWLTGDLVNRGPRSLEVLRFVRDLGDAVTTVLGNHDLHLVALAAGVDAGRDPEGSLVPVLEAADGEELIAWLRSQPLVHYDDELDTLLVHAGLPPEWSVKKALKRAAEVEEVLRGPDYLRFVAKIYGNTPDRWSGKLEGNRRLRYIVNALTRIRMVDAEGRLDFAHKGPPGDAKGGLIPWYAVSGARWRGTRIVFGHWSALGLMITPDVISLDTGCVWKRELTAVRLEGRPAVVQVDCSGA